MKISNTIVAIAIFLVLFFVIKNDYNSYYSKTISYLRNQMDKTSILSANIKDKVTKSIDTYNDNNTTNNSKKIETPGPLLVSDNLLTNNTKNIKLTSKGVIDITNKYRTENGNLGLLTENSKLNFSAEKKLQDMFVKGYFEHISPDGVGVGDLGTQVSYEYIIIGENLALGNFKDDKALVDAWMASPGHRANILKKQYTEIGVAVGKGSYNGNTVWMGVQHFGLPKSACPSIDEVLQGIIILDQKQIKSMEADMTSRRTKVESGVIYEGLTTSDQVEKYNSLVNDYNKLVIDIKNKINIYNGQVHSFNECIAKAN